MNDQTSSPCNDHNCGIIEYELSNGGTTKINSCILNRISKWKWRKQPRQDFKTFYVVRHDGMRLHRFILDCSKDDIIDHIDGDGLNNIFINLRIGTQSLNSVNRKTTPGPFLRGARPKGAKWQSYIKYKGIWMSLGMYGTEKEAHEIYLKTATKLYGDWMPLPDAPKEEK